MESLTAKGIYHVICIAPNGSVNWQATARNIITDQGKNAMLDAYFTGVSYTGAFYMSLIVSGTAINTSTYASPTVTEATNAVIAARNPVTWVNASGGAKNAMATVFSIIGSTTIAGNMLVGGADTGTVGDTSASDGVLFSAANFDGGSRAINSGDTLIVNYSISV